ncbi:MAG TPA: hypothetical protein VEA58_00885 [Anaerovoracaceae bacterium]|nr:hypothetical protein [Anaerovoracaceae bacterium]
MIIKNSFNQQCITYSQMNLIFNSRIYYRRLAVWTKIYLLSSYFGIGTAEELFSRLYYETLDLGNMLKIIHGRGDAEQYSQLLSQFAITLRDIITAQLEGNTEEVVKHVDYLYQIAAERAAFIGVINPYASQTEYENLFETYIQYVLEDANALATGDYSKDIELYDRITAHTDRMGDAFAEAIYKFITSGVEEPQDLQSSDSQQCITYDQMNAIFGISMFWFEFVIWIRNYMFSRYSGLGNTEEVYARLLQVPVDYVNALRQIFGDKVPEDYIELFFTYIDLLDALITAQMENNTEEIDRITKLLYENADARAAAITAINPVFWDESEWRTRLHSNLRDTMEESTAFLTEDYERSIDIFSRLLDQAEDTSNYFEQGLLNYINFNQSININV